MADSSTRITWQIRQVLDERHVDSLRSFTIAECVKQVQAPGWILFVKKNLAAGMNHLGDESSCPWRSHEAKHQVGVRTDWRDQTTRLTPPNFVRAGLGVRRCDVDVTDAARDCQVDSLAAPTAQRDKGPGSDDQDIERIAGRLNMSMDEVINTYSEADLRTA